MTKVYYEDAVKNNALEGKTVAVIGTVRKVTHILKIYVTMAITLLSAFAKENLPNLLETMALMFILLAKPLIKLMSS